MATDTLLTPEDVAAVLRIPARAVQHLVTSGQLPAIVLPGRKVRIEQGALDRFLAERRQ